MLANLLRFQSACDIAGSIEDQRDHGGEANGGSDDGARSRRESRCILDVSGMESHNA
jgi:hypothetical protein